jgi:hypothetical protein
MCWRRGASLRTRRLPGIERGDEGGRRRAREPLQAGIALGRRLRFFRHKLRRLGETAAGRQKKENRHIGPGAEKGGEAQRERLGMCGIGAFAGFGRGRSLLGRRLFPRRQRPGAEAQRKDAKGGGNLHPAAVDRPGCRRDSGEDQPERVAERRGRDAGRQSADAAPSRAGEADKGPRKQCGEKIRRHADTPRLNRRLAQTERKTIMIR